MTAGMVCCYLDMPRDDASVHHLSRLHAEDVLPTWLSFFRLMCVGFISFMAVSMVLPPGPYASYYCRIAICWNAIAFWLVSSAWCADTGTWCVLLIMQSLFTLLAVILLLDGVGMLTHMVFVAAGAMDPWWHAHNPAERGEQR